MLLGTVGPQMPAAGHPGAVTADLLKQISDLKMCNPSPGGRGQLRDATTVFLAGGQ